MSAQLTRRPVSDRQLVPTTPLRSNLDFSESWPIHNGELMVFDGDGINEVESVEMLEERAKLVMQDAVTRRKQIPPFVQKLSR
jgi:heat shock transcription factor